MGEARSPGALPLAQFEELLIGVRAPLYSFARSLLGEDQAARRRWLFNVAYHKAISLRRHNQLIAWQSLDEAPEVERAL